MRVAASDDQRHIHMSLLLKRTVEVEELLSEPATAFYICLKGWKLQERVTVAGHLGHICRSLTGWVLEIQYRPGSKKFIPTIMWTHFRNSNRPFQNEVYQHYKARYSGIQLDFSRDGERCTLSFSFASLVEMISPLDWRGDPPPCQSVTEARPPALELCSS